MFWNIPLVLGGREGTEPFLPPAKIFQSQIKKECKPGNSVEAGARRMRNLLRRRRQAQLPPAAWLPAAGSLAGTGGRRCPVGLERSVLHPALSSHQVLWEYLEA